MALRFENNGEKQPTPAKKKRTRNISFYLALVLCAGAIVLTALVNPADTGTEPVTNSPAGVASDLHAEESAEDSVTVNDSFADTWYVSEVIAAPDSAEAVQSTTTTAAPLRLPSTAPASAPTTSAAVPASAELRFGMPLSGSVTCGFSGNELVFSATMCDWRVHNGMDISGEYGDEVLACAGGIVEGFVEDMLYGNTAIIRHADDSVLYYCGLNDTQMVSAGLQVNEGDVIGYIGQIPCEMADGPHIHLALMKDGQFIDPAPELADA